MCGWSLACNFANKPVLASVNGSGRTAPQRHVLEHRDVSQPGQAPSTHQYAGLATKHIRCRPERGCNLDTVLTCWVPSHHETCHG